MEPDLKFEDFEIHFDMRFWVELNKLKLDTLKLS